MGYLRIPADFPHLPPRLGLRGVPHTSAPEGADAGAIGTVIKHLHKVRPLTSARMAGHSRAELIIGNKEMPMKAPLSC